MSSFCKFNNNDDIIEKMTSDNYFLDGNLKVSGSIISNKFINEAGISIGLPKDVDVKGSLKVKGSTELEKTLINNSLNVNGPVNINKNILKVDEIHIGNVKLTGKNALKIENNNGIIEIGAMNKDWGHIYTDRPKFAINKDLVDVKNWPYVNYIKYSADGSINIGNQNLADKDNSLRIKNNNGFIDIGAKNKDWGHIYTDRPKFAINRDLVDVKNWPYVNYIKYSADGGIKIQDYNLIPSNNDLLVNNSKTNKVSMKIHQDGTVSLINKLQPTPAQTSVSQTSVSQTPVAQKPARNYNNIIKNTDYAGNDLSYHNNQTIDSCKKLCDSNTRCAGFLRRDRDNSCWLKTDKVNNPTKFDGLDFYTTADFNPPKLVSAPDPEFSYSLSSRGMWAGEAPNEYSCVNEPSRNSVGNNGDYNRYCIFNTENDAKKYCNSDPGCKGYIANSANNLFQLTRKPIANTNANGSYFIKNTKSAPVTWDVNWTPKTGTVNFKVGNDIALHFNIRDNVTVMDSYRNNRWENGVIVNLPIHSYPRPLEFSVTFDKEFVIKIGSNTLTFPNRLSLVNANNIVADPSAGIIVTNSKPAATKPDLIRNIEFMAPIGWFDGNDFNERTQRWASKVGNATIITSNVRKATSPFPFVFGGTNSSLTNIPWPGRNKDYTFIHVAKYNGNTRGRIWTGIGGNWLSGFWNNSVAFFHEGWFDYNINASNSGRDWLLSVDMNNFVRVNRGTYQKNGPAFSPDGIAVSSGQYGNEKSDFAIAEFLIFNKKLSQAEYTKVEEYLAKKYGLFGSAKDPSLSPILQFSLTNIANDVKAGKYNNIRNSDFIISNNLNFWKLRTEFTSNDYYNSWQSIVGNMYNNEISGRGWGLWVNPQGIFHWSESSTTVNLNNLGRLQNNVSYRLDIVFNNNRYTFTLTNLSNNTQKSETINRGSSIITDRGFVTIGGAWRNVSSERFKGSINSMIVSTNNFN